MILRNISATQMQARKTNLKKEIQENSVYLERFFRNLLLGENHDLKNRYIHIDYTRYMAQGDNVNDNVNDNARLTANQQKIIDEVRKNPFVTQEELSECIGITLANINRNMKRLQEQAFVRRVGADKNGYWEILK